MKAIRALLGMAVLGLVWSVSTGCANVSNAAPGSESAVAESEAAQTTASPSENTLSNEVVSARRELCLGLGLDPDQITQLIDKPLYTFSEAEVDVYLRYLSAQEPDLRKRIAHLARKNLGQPYEIYLLGEMPFEVYDPQPLYCLSKSDCLVFTEHTYAMALTDNWSSFMRMLQRIRYKEGHISVATRNHYTESDWDPNNSWLVQDITADVAGDKVVRFRQKVDRAKFLRNRYGLETDIPVEEAEHTFIRFEDIDLAKPHLRDGDFVNIVRGRPAPEQPASDAAGSADSQDGVEGSSGTKTMQDIFGGSAWVGHTGLIVLGEGGEVHLIHSAKPEVREEDMDAYIARSTANNAQKDAAGQARLLGFKFLRLRDDPWANLRDVDGSDAPHVTLPGGGDWDHR